MRPLVPFLASFILGILASERFHLSYGSVYLWLAVSASVVLLLSIRGFKYNRYAASVPFFFLGALFMLGLAAPDLPRDHIKRLVEASSLKDGGEEAYFGGLGMDVEGTVISPPEAAGTLTRLTIEAERVFTDSGVLETSGKVLLTVNGRAADAGRGDTVRFLSKLKTPSNFGNPGEYDYKGLLGLKGIYVTGFVKSERLFVKVREGGGGILRPAYAARGRVRDFIGGAGVGNAEALKALIIGEGRGMDHKAKSAFIDTGTAHILSISGLHVGVVAWFSYSLILFLLKRSERLMLAFNVKKIAVTLMLAPVLIYGLLAGFPVSTQRAVIMAAAFAVTVLIDRGKDFYNVLALAALLILIVSPYSIRDVSFQLTFAAVLSIIYIVPLLDAFVPEEKKGLLGGNRQKVRIAVFLRRRVLPAFFVTVAASIGTYPILAYHFQRVSFTGLAANLVAVPLTGVIVPLLLASALALPAWEGLAAALLWLADAVFGAMSAAVRLFAALPYSSLHVTTPTLFEVLLFYLLVIAVFNARRGRLYRYAAPCLMLVIFLDWGWWGYQARLSRDLRVTFISVGQGDSALVEFPGGKTMLIDGGGLYGDDFDTGERVIAPFLAHKKIREIDYMVLSHSQRDHREGLKYIAENFNVREFWWNGRGELGALDEVLLRRGIAVKTMDGGSPKEDINGVRVEALHPMKGMELDVNDLSLVLKLTYGADAFLFAGDIGAGAEKALNGRDIRSSAIKVPHHGSRGSSGPAFLERVRPSIAVISAGRGNAFGFPHRETVERYEKTGARIFRTDVSGAVTLISNGRGIKANTYLTGDAP